MSKSNKFLTTMLLAAAGGAAAAVFIASRSGQSLKKRFNRFVKDYQKDPETKHSEWAEKVVDLKNTTVDRYSEVKQKFETGEWRPEDFVTVVKERAADFADKLTKASSEQEVAREAAEEAETVTPEEEITIDLDDIVTAEAHEAEAILDVEEGLEAADFAETSTSADAADDKDL